MNKPECRGRAPRWVLLLALLLPGCNGQPIMGDISLSSFGIDTPYLGDGYGYAPPVVAMPSYGWGGGWGGGWEDHGWGGDD